MVLATDINLVLMDIAVKMIRMLAELLAPGRFQVVLGMPRTSMLQNGKDGNVAAVAVEGHTEKFGILSSMAPVCPQGPNPKPVTRFRPRGTLGMFQMCGRLVQVGSARSSLRNRKEGEHGVPSTLNLLDSQ